MFKLIMYVLATVVLVAGVSAYTYHVWDDCLEENSVLTCARMLNK
jgi:hypothetical protein